MQYLQALANQSPDHLTRVADEPERLSHAAEAGARQQGAKSTKQCSKAHVQGTT